ncbi:hypothetical protein M23134_03262 [Microscilla marina ATCC 23134]|uniref:Uncharacterized protein n=1 Tax=Microscilla marina ATCC 23134 TaxID=313606 RepID=A1ZGK7_MICM2|nr:hypothetical protein M23134_03262 [Microscilla marina ATCC 23134]
MTMDSAASLKFRLTKKEFSIAKLLSEFIRKITTYISSNKYNGIF